MRIKFHRQPLDIEENNYASKIKNAYIVYESDTWTNNPIRNFALKIACLEQQI